MRGKAVGAMLGAAYGDALGWPNERVKNIEEIENNFVGSPSILKKWTRRSGGRFFPYPEAIQPGDYSDDTQLILSLSRSLIYGKIWWEYFSSVELPFWTVYERGGGGATKRAANAWISGVPPWQSQRVQDVKRYFNAGGNGVAMRILPHVIRLNASNAFSSIAVNIFRDGLITHGHPRALVGALAYGYALWRAARKQKRLAYGELIEDLALNVEEWSVFPDSRHIPENWWIKANEIFSNYLELWESAKYEIIDFLNICRTEIDKGALGNDDKALQNMQCFNRQINGAGTVACAAAVYLGSRYAADPLNGVVKAAYAEGSDTDTIASMTGGLVGLINGTEWLSSIKKDIQDAEYIEKTALALLSDKNENFSKIRPVKKTTLNNWLNDLLAQPENSVVQLPIHHPAKVVKLFDHIGTSGKYKVAKRKLTIQEGQSLFINKISKGEFSHLKQDTPQLPQMEKIAPDPVGSVGEMLIYRTDDGQIKLDVRLENETIWLTQQMIAKLFQVSIPNVSMHIKNVYEEGELAPESTIKKCLTVQKEGAREVQRDLTYYNLDMIISVGYRIKSLIATRFRIWATQKIKEYIIKGFVMDDERLKNPPVKNSSIPDYFDEMLARIRDIRASERRMYLRIKEIFALAGDYDPSWGETTRFFGVIQNKLHYAVTGLTAAELIQQRANAEQPNMGLTLWQKSEIRKTDVTIAKNYLKAEEIEQLNRIVVMWLDFAEDQANRRKQIFMRDWENKLNDFLIFNNRKILKNAGTISKQAADQYAKNEYIKFAECRCKTKEINAYYDNIKQLETFAKQSKKKY